MKIGCIIQGDVRRGTNQVLFELSAKFDFTVLSTWAEDEYKVVQDKYFLLLNKKPVEAGVTNRNYQRLTTANGIRAAREAGCDYVLKWRTDMLPTKLNIGCLLDWANTNVPAGCKSRIVMPSFRNLSVDPDWFSSIPDLFAFGHIDEMEMLWGDDGFDYSKEMNPPREMLREIEDIYPDLRTLFCAESELYARYKVRLQTRIGVNLNHPKIALDHFRLIDHKRLGIYWFGKTKGFRNITTAWEHPWWVEKNLHTRSVKIVKVGYPVIGPAARIRAHLSPLRDWINRACLSISWLFRI